MVRADPVGIPLAVARLIGIAAAVSLACGGCALIPLATVGAVVDIAGTAASAGPAVFRAGKLDVAFMGDSAVVKEAVRHAAADLCLHIVCDASQSKHGEIWRFQLEDDQQTKIEVTLDRRTPMLCLCRVNVGLFGSEPTARLVMSRIEHHLPPPTAPPTTSTSAKMKQSREAVSQVA